MDHGVIVDQSWWCHDDGSAMMRAVVRVEEVVIKMGKEGVVESGEWRVERRRGEEERRKSGEMV